MHNPLPDTTDLYTGAIGLLKQLIAIPSLSREEAGTADCIAACLAQHGIAARRHLHNVWAVNQYFDAGKPTILLNSHHDTVKPAPSYTRDPYEPAETAGRLYGLGSNDAGGPLVALIAAFRHFYARPGLPFNLLLAATAEEEISGQNGIEALLQHNELQLLFSHPDYPAPAAAIVGEPTLLHMAVAERGLLVLDCVARGRAGHAARNEGENALYKALQDIAWLQGQPFSRVSPLLGPVGINVTAIETPNKAHNVVPDECRFVADVRVNELYTLEEVVHALQAGMQSSVTPRSIRLRSSVIAGTHPLVQAGKQLGLPAYGSPTLSDKALIPCPALKLGPGDSARSHTADEFIYTAEIRQGIDTYIALLSLAYTAG
jgi:acetylornithine deacetylase